MTNDVARILVADDDEDIRDALRFLLEDAGYTVACVATLDDALALIDQEMVHLILTDSFVGRQRNAWAMLRSLRQRAEPTPVGMVTAWNLSPAEPQAAQFAFVIGKPFDVDQLLAQIAASLHTSLTDEQQRLASVVHAYFAALTARDWDALIDLCTDDVTYVLPGPAALAGTHVGKAAFRAYTEEIFAQFLDARFEQVQVYASPSGLATRYRGTWRMPDGSQPVVMGAVHFQFEGDRIKQIGVSLNDERLAALMRQPHAADTPSLPTAK